MNKSVKIWIIVASSLVLAGSIIFTGVMTVLKWDFSKLSTISYVTNKYDITADFKNISVETNTANLEILASENGNTSVVCFEDKKVPHSVKIEDGTLIITAVDERKWYNYVGINFKTPKITLYLPEDEYGSLVIKNNTGHVEIPKEFSFESIDIKVTTGNVTNLASASNKVKIQTSTGDITTKGISAGSLDLTVSTGNVSALDVRVGGEVNITTSTGKAELSNLECENLSSRGDTGSIFLKKVVASGKFDIKRSTGKVIFEDSDAAELFIETDTGSVKGNLLSSKVFIVKSDTGRVRVPDSITGGRCEITTDTGNIEIALISF